MAIAYYRVVLSAISIVVLLALMTGAYAQQKVYKWVDEEGVVHFSEEPPDESNKVKVETFTTDPAPPHAPPAPTDVRSQATSEARVAAPSVQPELQMPAPGKQMDIAEMSLAELDLRCEDAREKKIAPLREAEIAKCIETGTGDQAWCETFWADYGAPVRTQSGTLTPRMFHDLPECLEALDERHRRVSSH